MIGTLIGKIWDLAASFFSHPHVDIELKSVGFGKRNRGLIPSKEPIHVTEAVYNYDFQWDYVMIIKNNSSKPVFNLEIKEKPNFFYLKMPLNRTASLQPFERIELKCNVQHSDTIKGSDSVHKLHEFPYFTKNILIVICYQNEHHKRFYTTFEYDDAGQNNEYKKK